MTGNLGPSGETVATSAVPQASSTETRLTRWDKRSLAVVAIAVGLAVLALLLLAGWPHLIEKAAQTQKATDSTFDNLTHAVGEIDKDALIVDGIGTPLACIVGAIGLALGNQNGTKIIFTSLGVLAFVGCIEGIVK